jgi:hypothetical protein
VNAFRCDELTREVVRGVCDECDGHGWGTVVGVPHGKLLNGRCALITTDGKNWLIHRTP